jgi:PncC family amidohydrolase
MPAAPSEADLEAAAMRLGDLLLARGWQFACAESSTAGMIAASVTTVPGSSRYFRGGVVAYANEAKIGLLGVPVEMIANHGAVSVEVAAAMAEGVRERLGADLAVAVTGIAGPDGGSAAKPVGLHYLGASRAGTGPTVERQVFAHDRAGNRRSATLAALNLAISLAEAS